MTNPESDDHLLSALEAILMVVQTPVPVTDLASVLGTSEAEVDDALRTLAHDYETGPRRRGFELREVGGGWRMYSGAEWADVVGQFVIRGQSGRLSAPALETLAVIAYQQPVTRAQVAQIRGVNVDGVVRTLMTRGLVEPVGEEPTSGAVLYGTSGYFLEAMGMVDLSDLPPMAPHLPDVAHLDETERSQS